MGNNLVVQAASTPNDSGGVVSPPLTASAPPPAATSGASPASKSTDSQKTTKKTNPGVFEDLHKRCKDLFPAPFDGFRLCVNKGLSNHFQVSHTLNLSSAPQGTSYHFGATYVGGNQTSPTEAYPVILGDIDNSGSLSAQIIHQFTNRIKGKCVVQTQQKEFAMVQVDADYRGDDYTATCTLGNIDVINESGIIVNHYLHQLTENLDVGAELLYHYGQGQESAVLSLASRYSTEKWVAAGQINPAGWHASYYHKGNDNISVGVDYEYSSRMQDSCVSLGYQVDIPKANVTFRGLVDTNWTVAGFFEKRLHPLPFTFLLSGMINHQKNQSRFGFGLQIG
ncbi:mitochondrial import receptor subunit TOM40 homolog [Hydractinia symbiolongicarpus]|uniref:mitochondrial import receptor subunit TOM40 homolog n=1 Tax=Hydractinia symbiolongicarpus TaxID=13093 RepID=UPI00254F7CB1|nr:mitochondrial import receptor subunit TOM40 homolog [Hydractinia symbiolongicarpus]